MLLALQTEIEGEDGIEVEGILKSFPFRGRLVGQGTAISAAVVDAVKLKIGEEVEVEITRVGKEAEVRVPAELIQALAEAPDALETWRATTALARRDWVLWMTTGKSAETRRTRVEKACSMLAQSKRRVCCFGGLKWLTKDHPKAETWATLPK